MPDRWSKQIVLVHWVVAVLIGGLVVVGATMANLPADSAVRPWLARLHTLGGLSVVALTVARLVALRLRPRPAPLPVSDLHRRGIGVLHVLLYVVTLVLGASGFVTARLSEQTWHEYLMGRLAEAPALDHLASRGVHGALVPVLVALVALHVGGVLVQEARAGGTLRRMIPSLK